MILTCTEVGAKTSRIPDIAGQNLHFCGHLLHFTCLIIFKNGIFLKESKNRGFPNCWKFANRQRGIFLLFFTLGLPLSLFWVKWRCRLLPEAKRTCHSLPLLLPGHQGAISQTSEQLIPSPKCSPKKDSAVPVFFFFFFARKASSGEQTQKVEQKPWTLRWGCFSEMWLCRSRHLAVSGV